jgi:phage RecT family recombinase
MSNEITNYNKIKSLVSDEKSVKHYATVLGNQTQAEKYLNTALQYILKNRKIQLCNPQSVKNCVYDAVNMKLYLDSRQHAYIIPYNNEATLQVGWRGYVAKLKEANQTIDVRVGVIWPEDTFSISESTYIDTYELKRGKPFRSDYHNVSGTFCLLSYTIGNQKYAKITLMDREEINKVKGCAKTKNVWESWEGEQICKTVIKRAAKVNFASAIADLDAKDNQQYDLNKAKEADNPKVDYVDNGELPKPKEKNIVETTAVEEKKAEGQVDDEEWG